MAVKTRKKVVGKPVSARVHDELRLHHSKSLQQIQIQAKTVQDGWDRIESLKIQLRTATAERDNLQEQYGKTKDAAEQQLLVDQARIAELVEGQERLVRERDSLQKDYDGTKAALGEQRYADLRRIDELETQAKASADEITRLIAVQGRLIGSMQTMAGAATVAIGVFDEKIPRFFFGDHERRRYVAAGRLVDCRETISALLSEFNDVQP